MRLSEDKIRAEIQSPSKAKEINEARVQQERIKFHADTNLDVISSVPLAKFKTFVGSLLPKDKFELVMNLLKFPIPTNEVTDSVWTKLAKIFDGRNPAMNYQFHSTEERDDWEYYRQDVLKEPEVWSDKAWDYFKTEINCVMVVDMPEREDPSDKYPQPYFYFVPIENVVSYKVNKRTGNMKWIIFRDDDKFFVIDEESYRTYARTESGGLGALLSDNAHNVPYCPARFFWSEPLTLSNPDIKKSPLSKVLSDLDWYLFYFLSKKHLDLYGSYPIYSGYEQECDYTNDKGDSCQHGYLVGNDGHYHTDELGNPIPCPLCRNKKNLAGPGTYVDVPVPQEGGPDLRNPVQILTIDKKALEYNVEELDRIKNRIISSCVGMDNTILNETSLADKQVDATFESQEDVLSRVKKGFESAQQWVDTTICIIRYADSFISARVNYGTEFYTLTPEVLRKRYKDAKESGASEAELDALNQQMLETEYRHNPLLLQRMIILSDLEPYRHSSKTEVLNMFKEGLVDIKNMRLKLDFSGFIRRFERENENILEFGSKIPYSEKINQIKNTLLSYAEQQTEKPA